MKVYVLPSKSTEIWLAGLKTSANIEVMKYTLSGSAGFNVHFTDVVLQKAFSLSSLFVLLKRRSDARSFTSVTSVQPSGTWILNIRHPVSANVPPCSSAHSALKATFSYVLTPFNTAS